MIIILFTPYKTGSTNIFFKFKENNCNCIYEEELLNNLNFSLPSDKISVIKMHSKDKFSLKYKLDKLKLEPDLIITCVRNLDEIYISGYYQNLFLLFGYNALYQI